MRQCLPSNVFFCPFFLVFSQEVAELFEPSIKATIDAVKAQIEEAPHPINVRCLPLLQVCRSTHISQAVYLVGGFAASPYLISTLKQRLASSGVTVSVPDAQTWAKPVPT